MNDIAAAIREAQRIALISHVSPDPDAIGSMLGLMLGLDALGKDVTPYNQDGMPTNLTFLPGADRVKTLFPGDYEPDLLITLDSADYSRIGELGQVLTGAATRLANIDHHATNDRFGDAAWVLDEAASTAEMIPALLSALGVTMTVEMATCLMTGILSDTLGFSTVNVTPGTLRIAADLVTMGADIAHLSEVVLRQQSYEDVQIWSIGFSHMTLEDRVLWTTISMADRSRLGVREATSAELSNHLKYVNEADIVAVFTEVTVNEVRLSMRSRAGIDISGVAMSVGGGGHTQAAGATMALTLEQAVEAVVPRLKALLQ